MNQIDQLLRVVEAYAAHTGLAEATISTRFAGRGARIGDLRQGGDMGSRTIACIIQKFSENWPEGAIWPADVPRPSPSTPLDEVAE
jgi:hypothetical protein